MKFLTKKSLILWFLAYTAVSFLGLFFFDVQSIKDTLGYLWLIAVLTVIPMWLILLPIKYQVFDVWKRFAVVAVPVTAMTGIWIINHNWSDWLGIADAFYLGLLYLLYSLVSLVIIFRAWWKGRVSE